MTAFFASLLRSIWPLMELPEWFSAFIQSAGLGSWLNHSLSGRGEPQGPDQCLDATGGHPLIVRWVHWPERIGCGSARNTRKPSSTDSRLGVRIICRAYCSSFHRGVVSCGGFLRAAEGTGLFPRVPTSDGQTSGRFSVLHPSFHWPAVHQDAEK